MRTECFHRTLSPQAYAALQDHLRREAETERLGAIQAFFAQALSGFRSMRPAPSDPQRSDGAGAPAMSQHSPS